MADSNSAMSLGLLIIPTNVHTCMQLELDSKSKNPRNRFDVVRRHKAEYESVDLWQWARWNACTFCFEGLRLISVVSDRNCISAEYVNLPFYILLLCTFSLHHVCAVLLQSSQQGNTALREDVLRLENSCSAITDRKENISKTNTKHNWTQLCLNSSFHANMQPKVPT